MNKQERRVPIEEARKRPEWWRRLNGYREVDFRKREKRLEIRRLEREIESERRLLRRSIPSPPRIKTNHFYQRTSGKIHNHVLSEIKKNHQGREFVRCLTCGGFSFGDTEPAPEANSKGIT